MAEGIILMLLATANRANSFKQLAQLLCCGLFTAYLAGCSTTGYQQGQQPDQQKEGQSGFYTESADTAIYWSDEWMQPLTQRLGSAEHSAVVAALFSQAEQSLRAGKRQFALSYLDKARTIEPRNTEILLRQAWVRAGSGEQDQIKKAEQLLGRALTLTGECGQRRRLNLLRVQLLRQLGASAKADALESKILASRASGTC